TFLEVNYMILQSYDFRELRRRHDVLLQIGGSDQWGNIVSGMGLTRRSDGRQVFGLSTPLIFPASEAKKILATAATALAHGQAAADAAAETARRAFEEGEAAETLPGVEVPHAE